MLTRSSPCINVIEPNKMEPSFYEWTSLQFDLAELCLLTSFSIHGKKKSPCLLFLRPLSWQIEPLSPLLFCELHLNCPILRKWMNDSPSIQLRIFCSWPTLSCECEFCHQGWIKILTGSYSLISTMNNDLTLSAISETFPLTSFMLNWAGLKSWDRHMGGSPKYQ